MHLVSLRKGRHAAAVEYDPALARTLAHELSAAIRGEVCFDAGSRALYATDASNYRQVPIGVVRPIDAQDVLRTLAVCRSHGIPVLGRGGGTSLGGQCCNVAVVLDFTRHMNRVLQVDRERRIARVQPGVVLDDLRKEAQRVGLTFGPDPATHDRCTLGGMIGNNSCGVHAVQSEFYGPGPRTEHNVETLDVVTYDGTRMVVGRTSDQELAAIIAGGGRRADIYRQLVALRDRYDSEIRERFPDIPRRVSGYNLPALLDDEGFDVARALCGTESTCVIVLEATLHLIDHLPKRALVAIGYETVDRAGDDVERIRAFKPIGCEGIDDRLVKYIKEKHLHAEYLGMLPEGKSWLVVEFGAQTQEHADSQARALMAALEASGYGKGRLKFFDDATEQEKVWEVRESGLGATAFVPGQPDSWEGWEDSAVKPERLGDYLRELRSLLDQYGYDSALYGHFAHGCIHARIDFCFSNEEGIEKFKAFTRDAAELVVRHGGSLSGEHGDGQARGDLLEVMFGPTIMQAFREFKTIFDPEFRMNPGKLIEAWPRDVNLRLGPDYQPWKPETHFQYPEDGGRFHHATIRCVGVGKCRRSSGGTMCPSYMVTHEEKHSTRGRAHLLHEMLRRDVIDDGWRSEAVKESLELCLSCKGCKTDCPVNVDIATYKAEFLAHYYEGRPRPRHAYAFGLIPFVAPIASHVAGLVNLAARTPGVASLMKSACGMASGRNIPEFARQSFRSWFRKQARRNTGQRRVFLWPDTFNDYFHPATLVAALEALEHAGVDVVIPERRLCCGRPLYDYGMLDRAKSLWQEILDELGDQIDERTPLVGIEPSCVAAFRDELRGLFPNDPRAERLAKNTFTLSEFLMDHLPGYQPPRLTRSAVLHGHCHHKAVMKLKAECQLLEKMGVQYELLDSGCCGMAGAFGFEKDKFELSLAIGERVLLPAVRNAGDDVLVLADGFSCREQVRQCTEREAVHIAEVIQLALHHDVLDDATHRPEHQLRELAPRALRARGGNAARAAGAAATIGAGALYWLLGG